MTRSLLQPSPSVGPPEVITTSLTASLTSGACPHYVYISTAAGPTDKVITEYSSSSGWVQIANSGVTALQRSTALGKPSRVTGLYGAVASTIEVRVRPKPGFAGDTIAATLVDTSSIPGALLRGASGFKATVAGTTTKTCTVKLTPGGNAHQVIATAFAKFSGKAYLYVYDVLPVNAANLPPPGPAYTTETTALTLLDPPEAGVYQAAWAIPASFTSAYVIPFVSWASVDCAGCVDASFKYPTVDTYPLILQATPA